MGKFKRIIFLGAMVSVVSGAGAETITKPHNFTSGTTIRSSQMNENFDAIFQELNRLRTALETCQCGGSSSLSEGLVAYYPFNGNANDESGNENNGAVRGANLAEDRFENVNSAYSFDGIDDYIEISDNDILDLPRIGTICVWFERQQKNGDPNNAIIAKYKGDTPGEDGYIIAGIPGTVYLTPDSC